MTDGTGSVGQGNPTPPDGSQVAFIQGVGAVTQSVNFSSGTYSLSFYAAQRAEYDYGTQTFEVLVDGIDYGSYTPGSSSYDFDSATFTVTAGYHTITFEGTVSANVTALVDDLSITKEGGGSTPTIADPSFESVYVGGGYSYSITPPPPNMKLVSATFNSYDDQGQLDYTQQYDIDPATNSIFTSSSGSQSVLGTNYYYDADGNLIAAIGPTGAATKYTYNGADWNTFTYATDGGQLNNFSNVGIGSSTAYAAASSVGTGN